MSRTTIVLCLASLLLGLSLAEGMDHCSCDDLEQRLASLALSNPFADVMEEGTFYRSVTPRPTLGAEKELLYYNSELARSIGLDLDQFTSDHCVQQLLEYLTFEKQIPGSKPIVLPHAEFRYYVDEGERRTSASLVEQRNGKGVILGTLTTPTGESLDLFVKGVSDLPFPDIGKTLSLQDAIFELVMGDAAKSLGAKTVHNIAVIGTPQAHTEKEGRDSSVIVLQAAPTFLRAGSIEYFLNLGKQNEANALLNYIQEHFHAGVALSANYGASLQCTPDDDDDEEDDDEFCYREGTEDLLAAIAIETLENGMPLMMGTYQPAIISSGTFAVDGTVLDFRHARFKELGHVDLLNCGPTKERKGDPFPQNPFILTMKATMHNIGRAFELSPGAMNDMRRKMRKVEKILPQKLQLSRYGLDRPDQKFLEAALALEMNRKTNSVIDWGVFLRLLGDLGQFPTTNVPHESSLDEFLWTGFYGKDLKVFATIIDVIQLYRNALGEQYLTPGDRKSLIRRVHPSFLPRVHTVAEAIKGIENRNTTSFDLLMKMVHKELNESEIPEEWKRPGRSFTFACQEEDQWMTLDGIRRVSREASLRKQ